MDFLFDIGNVIVGVDFAPSLKRLMAAGIENADDRFHRLIERKDDFEAGRITPDEYFPWAAEQLGHQGSMEDFMSAWLDIFSPNPAMWDCIEQLSQDNHRLILFSNINNPHKQHLLDHYPVFNHFAGGVFSYQTGFIKPEDEIYQLAIKQYQLEPENTIYIDDLAANIEGGRRAGFQSHQYSMAEHQAFLQWLDQIL